MKKNQWQSPLNRLIGGMLVCVLVPLVMYANRNSNVQAQEALSSRPIATHVVELGRYLDQVEVYAPIIYRDLMVYPLRLRDSDKLRGGWLTMDQALSRKVLVVTEKMGGGRVPMVSVENRSRDDTVFLMSGEVLAGGKQTRTVRQDVVLAPGQRIDLNVFCVEARRWKGKAEFTAAYTLLPQSIQKELRKGADQKRVWSEIARNNMSLDAENNTGSLELALNSDKVKSRLADVRKKVVPEVPDDTVGFIFVDGRRAVGANLFGREDLARSLFPKLLDAYAVDIVLQRKSDSQIDRAPDRDEAALKFLRDLRNVGSERCKTPGSGAGIRTRRGGLLGDGVSLGGLVVHCSAQIQDRIIPLPKPRPERPLR